MKNIHKILILVFIYLPTVIAWILFAGLFKLMTILSLNAGLRGNIQDGQGMSWKCFGVVATIHLNPKRQKLSPEEEDEIMDKILSEIEKSLNFGLSPKVSTGEVDPKNPNQN